MKLTYFQSHWTAEEAITIMHFLDDLKQGIEASYREDIGRWYCDMAQTHAEARGHIAKVNESRSPEDEPIPF